jgi:hypothetical protein
VHTFTLRDDFHFSPPSGAAVTALAFKRTFERTLHQQMASPAQPFFDDIDGAKEVIAGQQTEISGIVASGQTLSFTLEEPAADFLNRLALPFACPLPIGTAVTPTVWPLRSPARAPTSRRRRTPSRAVRSGGAACTRAVWTAICLRLLHCPAHLFPAERQRLVPVVSQVRQLVRMRLGQHVGHDRRIRDPE